MAAGRPVARTWTVTPPGEPVPAAEPSTAERDPLAQLAIIVGSGTARTFDWPRVEHELGLPLPTDYKRLHESYGTPVNLNGIFVSPPDELVSLQDMNDPVAAHPSHAPKPDLDNRTARGGTDQRRTGPDHYRIRRPGYLGMADLGPGRTVVSHPRPDRAAGSGNPAARWCAVWLPRRETGGRVGGVDQLHGGHRIVGADG